MRLLRGFFDIDELYLLISLNLNNKRFEYKLTLLLSESMV